MPRPASPLPTADAFYRSLDRPPWHGLSSMELSRLLKVPLNYVWNHTMRGQLEGEPPEIHVRASNRRLYLPCLVLTRLAQRDGETIPPWAWCARWLIEHHLLSAEREPTPAAVRHAVLHLERGGRVLRRRWKVRLDRWLDRLEEVLEIGDAFLN